MLRRMFRRRRLQRNFQRRLERGVRNGWNLSPGNLSLSLAPGKCPGNQPIQVVTVRPIRAKALLIKQALDPAAHANLIGMFLYPDRPAHLSMPASSKEHNCRSTQPCRQQAQGPQTSGFVFLFRHRLKIGAFRIFCLPTERNERRGVPEKRTSKTNVRTADCLYCAKLCRPEPRPQTFFAVFIGNQNVLRGIQNVCRRVDLAVIAG